VKNDPIIMQFDKLNQIYDYYNKKAVLSQGNSKTYKRQTFWLHFGGIYVFQWRKCLYMSGGDRHIQAPALLTGLCHGITKSQWCVAMGYIICRIYVAYMYYP